MPDSPNNWTPVPGPSQSYPMPPTPPLNAVPPRKQGSSALKIILIIVGIFVVLGAIGVGVVGYGVYRVSKAVHKEANGQFTIKTPFGAAHTVSSATFSENDLGIAIYPGAVPSKDGVRLDMGGKTMITGIFLTPDAKEKVIAFYKDKAGPRAEMITTGNGMEIHHSDDGAGSVGVGISQSTETDGGKTKIVIQHAYKNPSAN